MRLSEFITANLEPILKEWEAYAKGIPATHGMNHEELRDHAKQMLEAIAKDLSIPETENQQKEKSKGNGPANWDAGNQESAAEQHASLRVKSGFGIVHMISEYRALRASVLRLWSRDNCAAQQTDLEDMTRFNEGIDQAVAESVARFSSTVEQSQDLFLGILGHDLRNPLGAIIMSAQLQMQDVALDSRYIKTASIIYNNGNQMSRLINDLLDFARTRLGQDMPISPVQMNLADIVEHAVAQVRAFHPDHAISFNAAGDLHGQWDAARIGQVFSNLLGNAIKHGSDREPVTVVLSCQDEDVIATVHNGGKPIPENDLLHIFDPLRQSADSTTAKRYDSGLGLGLGLYIAREIIQAHGGTVNVTSSIDEGTTFTVSLPHQRP